MTVDDFEDCMSYFDVGDIIEIGGKLYLCVPSGQYSSQLVVSKTLLDMETVRFIFPTDINEELPYKWVFVDNLKSLNDAIMQDRVSEEDQQYPAAGLALFKQEYQNSPTMYYTDSVDARAGGKSLWPKSSLLTQFQGCETDEN